MPNYRRVLRPGGTYFFTVVTFDRRPLFADGQNRELLRTAIKAALEAKPFGIDAICLLPDHLHAVWTLPEGDRDYATRWGRIKGRFSHDLLGRLKAGVGMPTTAGPVGFSRESRGEVRVWQPRFWEHAIRDEEDLRRHVDYVHFNPVKHGLVNRPMDWEWSSFRRNVREGLCEPTWGETEPEHLAGVDRE